MTIQASRIVPREVQQMILSSVDSVLVRHISPEANLRLIFRDYEPYCPSLCIHYLRTTPSCDTRKAVLRKTSE